MITETFEEAVEQFKAFLLNQGAAGDLFWCFREDLLFLPGKFLVARHPLPPGNLSLSRQLYGLGAQKGLASIHAIGSSRRGIIATVWLPLERSEEVQGWNTGLKFSIAKPMPNIELCRSGPWWFLRRSPSYRRFQANAFYIHSRDVSEDIGSLHIVE